MSRLKVRCLGGLEVWRDDRPVSGFESQKVRGLFAYLACNRDRILGRDQLAGLLWPDKDDASARRNLRQALYNLRSALGNGEDGEGSPIFSEQHSLSLASIADFWVDVEAFEEAVARGNPEDGGTDLHYLTKAAQLYRGDFLANFSLGDSEIYEAWQLSEQERLRETAITILHALVDTYLSRGEFRYGVQYAQRLVRIDPLSEEAHRQLMRLYALSGQRSRALDQFEELRELLHRELGVEPLEETRDLYETIIIETAPGAPAIDVEEPIGPIIPFVGRGSAYAELRESWQQVVEHGGRLTLLTGEAGVGKTRLIKSFLDAATAQRQAQVLTARCHGMSPPVSFRPFSQILSVILEAGEMPSEADLGEASPEVLAAIAHLTPSARASGQDSAPKPKALRTAKSRQELFEAVKQLLLLSAGSSSPPDPLILFIDDLQWVDSSSLSLLEYLARDLAGDRLWIIGAASRGAIEGDGRLAPLLELAASTGRADTIRLERLTQADVEEIANSLLDEEDAHELATYLIRFGQGLPLHIAELINTLWDHGVLVAQTATRWHIEPSIERSAWPEASSFSELVARRVRRLPTSTRRLLSMAAVTGQAFEVDALQRAADEHKVVVEVGVELMLRRWLVRQYAPQWSGRRRMPDLVLWAGGARRGLFEFAHETIRRSIYEEVNPLRRQTMHESVAEALEQIYRDDRDEIAEEIGHHYFHGKAWTKALPYLVTAARKSKRLLDEESTCHYLEMQAQTLSRLISQGGSDDELAGWRGRRKKVEQEITKKSG